MSIISGPLKLFKPVKDTFKCPDAGVGYYNLRQSGLKDQEYPSEGLNSLEFS